MKYPKIGGNKDIVSDFKENYEAGARFRLFWDSIIDHPYVGFKKPFGKDTAWIWMIFEARREPQKGKLIKGKTPMNDRCIDIPYASFVASRGFLAKAWGWSEQSVRTFLKNLQKLSMIETKVIQNLTMITICNFDDYQNPSTNRQPIVNQSLTRTPTGKQGNKETNVVGKTDLTPAELARKFFDAWRNPSVRGERFKKYAERLGGELDSFCKYWTERTRSGKKERWEIEKTWELPLRIGTWNKNKERRESSNGKFQEEPEKKVHYFK